MKQRSYPATKAILLSLVLSVFLISCDDDDDDMPPPPSNKTITQIVSDNDAFSTLESAVVKADLAGTLSSPGPFTVFAPDNNAFTASGITPAMLNGLNQEQTASILLYHTLAGEVTAAKVPAGPNASVTTASGDSVFVTRNAAGVYVNGIKVEEADIDASNGVIHRIGKVLIPPSGDIVATAQAAGSGLDSLVKAVIRANNETGGSPSLVATLKSAKLTLFAPDNNAFTQLLDALGLVDINQVPVPTLLAVLQYHVVGDRVFSPDLTNGSLPMLGSGSTTVNLTNGTGGGPTITGGGNGGTGSNIIRANIVATNGVIHVIDRVLLPG